MALQAEGHPIFPGSTGENVTLAGVDWDFIEPGVVLDFSSGVRLEVTGYAVPCQNIRDSFRQQSFRRLSPGLHPGWSRAYTRVLRGGLLRPGDEIRLLIPGS